MPRRVDPAPVGDGMDDVRQHLRGLIARLKAEGKIRHLADWCVRAGVAGGGVSTFLSGGTRSPNLATLMALAAAVDLPVSVVIGNAADRDELMRLVGDWLAHAPADEQRQFTADLLRYAAAVVEEPPPPPPAADWRSSPGPSPSAPAQQPKDDAGQPRRPRP